MEEKDNKHSLSIKLEEVQGHSVPELIEKLEELDKKGVKTSIAIAVLGVTSIP